MVDVACGVLKKAETVRDMDGVEFELAEGTMVYMYDENTKVDPGSLKGDIDDPLGITPSTSNLLVDIDGNMEVIYTECSEVEFMVFKTNPVEQKTQIPFNMIGMAVNTVEMHTIYNAVFKHPQLENLFKYVFSEEFTSEEFELLLHSKYLQFFITADGIKSISVDGRSHYLSTPMPLDVCMTFFGLYTPVSVSNTTVYKLQLLKNITPDEYSKYSKLITGWKVGNRPLTLEMLQSGFSARIDVGGLFDIVVDGHIVSYAFDQAFMLYEDWYSVLVIDDEINTITTTSEFVLHVTYDEKNWVNMLDDIIDDASIEQVVENKVNRGCATGYTCVDLNVETKVLKPEYTQVRYIAVYKKCLASCVSEM